MTKQILDVGNCRFDHNAIRGLIESNFDAQVIQTHTREDTLQALRADRFHLVLINRKLDRDRGDGLDLVKAIKTDEQLAGVPVMLITNYPEHQELAEAAGAERGFGKTDLSDPGTLGKLSRILHNGGATDSGPSPSEHAG
jgi:CheY-like chemotaxis protein